MPARKSGAFKGGRRHREAARSCTSPSWGAEASGLEHDARAGINLTKKKPWCVLPIERIIGK
jgi:hypothetical protein